MSIYLDRRQAGRVLAGALHGYQGRADVLVLALPRGGVPVAYEVASAIGAPLDVFVVRKLGVPRHEELAMGAVASGGVRVLNDEVVDELNVPDEVLDSVVTREIRELERREKVYRGDRPPLDVAGKTVVLIDDGLATGSTMRAAIAGLRQLHPHRIVVAVPIAAASTCRTVSAEVDEMVCAVTPDPFIAVGLWYDDFSATSDDEVRALLAHAQERAGAGGRYAGSQPLGRHG
jgi:predicted phosphoribosyltransferase